MTHNVAVVVLDTTRALDTVPADPAVAPTLAALAGRGTEYTRAFATAPWTLPSHASLFTGTYPSKHGAHGEHTVLDGEYPTLAETFGAAGYETVSVSNNAWVSEAFGFDRGFDVHREFGDAGGDRHPREIPADGTDPATDDGAARTVTWLREWLDGRDGDDPFFLFANFVEPHLAYRPPRADAEAFLPEGWSYEAAMEIPQDPRAFDAGEFDLSAAEFAALRGLYRAEIAYLDERLGEFVAALEAAGERAETVLAVVGDHGENIGEHGLLGHQYRLTDTLLHVPLVIDGGTFAGGGTIDDLVQVLDLAPTLLDAAGPDAADAREHFQGRSLHPDAGVAPREAVFAEYMAPQPGVETLEEQYGDLPPELYDYERSLRAVRTDRYKYVRGSDGTERLYDLAADDGETTDRSDDRPGATADLRERLESWLRSFDHAEGGDDVSIDDATEQRLSDLGYL